MIAMRSCRAGEALVSIQLGPTTVPISGSIQTSHTNLPSFVYTTQMAHGVAITFKTDRSAAMYGLLEEEKAARRAADGDHLASAPGSASDALTGSLGSLADTDLPSAGVSSSDAVLHSLAVDCLPSPLPSRLPSLQAPGAPTETLAGNSGGGGTGVAAAGGDASSGSGHGSSAGGDVCNRGRSSGSGGDAHTVVVINSYCAPSAADVAAEARGTSPSKASAADSTETAESAEGASTAAGAGSIGNGAQAADASAALVGLLTITDMAPLLEAGAASSSAGGGAGCTCTSSCSACGGTGKTAAGGGGRYSCCGGGGRGGGGSGGLLARLRRWVATADWREMRRIIAFGSVAGFTSGVMGGMTGIGGPPIMVRWPETRSGGTAWRADAPVSCSGM